MSINKVDGLASADDLLTGSDLQDLVQGFAGNDVINGNAGDDQLYGDYQNIVDLHALLDGQAGSTMESFGATDGWTYSQTESGQGQMTQTLTAVAGTEYTLSLDLASNMVGGAGNAAVEIVWNDTVVKTVELSSGAFNTYELTIMGTGTATDLTIRTVEPMVPEGPVINTDGPIFFYDKEVQVQGETVTVQAFAEGQGHIYQVIAGTLHLFDAETSTYVQAGADATVNVNAIGFNTEDGLIYGVAADPGVDSRGNPINTADLVMMDAQGNSYAMGATPYTSWTGDFDDNGNLYIFESDVDRITVIDVDQLDANGNPVTWSFDVPADLVTKNLYDVAYDASTQSFYGLCRAAEDGQPTTMYQIDISQVASGGEPQVFTVDVTQTVIDGVTIEGTPRFTFGAAVIDADGNMFVGGNNGNHDLDDATEKQGVIYQVIVDDATGTAKLVFVADAPFATGNDGASDPTASDLLDPEISSVPVLVRDISLVPDTAEGFDDVINGGGGHDMIDGSIGSDVLIGDAQGDELIGGDGSDELYGGAGPNWTDNGLVSVYDADGNRFDQFGNPLPEDDDVLFGGAGDDMLSGSAGHDTLDGGLGEDILKGGSGFDVLYGAEHNDELFGGANDDDLYGGAGADVLTGGSGNDMLNSGAGVDTAFGGSGNDIIKGGEGIDVLKGGTGEDTLYGDTGVDFLDGGSGNDVLYGGDAEDTLKGNSGNDTMYGGDDRDNMNGGSGNDEMHGDAGNDYLNGYKGDDVLFGGDGNDKIVLGEGSDIATGGAGVDTFVFKSDDLSGGTDRILDFTVGEDALNFASLDIEDGQAWFDENVTLNGNQATIQMGNASLELTLVGSTDATDLFDTMVF